MGVERPTTPDGPARRWPWAPGSSAVPPSRVRPAVRMSRGCWRCARDRCWKSLSGAWREDRMCCWSMPREGIIHAAPAWPCRSVRFSSCRPLASRTGRCWPVGNGRPVGRARAVRCGSVGKRWGAGCGLVRGRGRWRFTRVGAPASTPPVRWCWPPSVRRERPSLCARHGGSLGALVLGGSDPYQARSRRFASPRVQLSAHHGSRRGELAVRVLPFRPVLPAARGQGQPETLLARLRRSSHQTWVVPGG